LHGNCFGLDRKIALGRTRTTVLAQQVQIIIHHLISTHVLRDSRCVLPSPARFNLACVSAHQPRASFMLTYAVVGVVVATLCTATLCTASQGTEYLVEKGKCRAQLLAMCKADSQAQNRAMMFPFQGKDPSDLAAFEQDLASFLLARGPHAFLGHSWAGCRTEYSFPDALNADYGEPTELCHETSHGVFERDWTKAKVRVRTALSCPSVAPSVR